MAATPEFFKGSRTVRYSQSAVTVQVRQLEKELGTPLFERIGKRVSLTERGMEFTAYANEKDYAGDQPGAFVCKKISGGPDGTLRISGVDLSAALLPDLLHSLLCRGIQR